jgi:hypothetical protein
MQLLECGGRSRAAAGDTALGLRACHLLALPNSNHSALKTTALATPNPRVWQRDRRAQSGVTAAALHNAANGSFLECGGKGRLAAGDTAFRCRGTPNCIQPRTLQKKARPDIPTSAQLARLACHQPGAPPSDVAAAALHKTQGAAGCPCRITP